MKGTSRMSNQSAPGKSCTDRKIRILTVGGTIDKIYFDAKSTYEVGEPETIEKDGMLMVVQSESSHVIISDETLEQIIGTTAEIRNRQLGS